MRTLLLCSTSLSLLVLFSCSDEKKAPAPPETPQFTAAKTADGSGGRFTVRFPHKAADLAFAQVLFGKQDPSAPPFCFIHYDPASTELKLYRGPNPLDFTPGAKPGTASDSVQNDSCAVDTAQSSAADSGDGLVLNVTVRFKAPMAGEQVAYERSMERGGADTNWRRVGTWTASASAQ